MSEFKQFNLSNILEQLGEERTKEILSSFFCPLNRDVEDFCRSKAVEFSKRGFAQTLIAQLSKNFADGNDTLISGSEILQMAIERIRKIQQEIGGKFLYLECEEKEKLLKFYEKNNFVSFGRRKLDKDETNLEGAYLVQLLQYRE